MAKRILIYFVALAAVLCLGSIASDQIDLTSSGIVSGWGLNNEGQYNVPAPNENFVAIVAVYFRSMGLKSTGEIVTWGANWFGLNNVPAPNQDFKAIAAGMSLSLGLKTTGEIVAWGINMYGVNNVPVPNQDFKAIAAGNWHGLGLKNNGKIVAWGLNDNGQCNVPAGNNFVAIAAGGYFSLALKDDGTVVAWGDNSKGQCNVPPPSEKFVAISGGGQHSLGLKEDGTVVAWGDNGYGQCNVPLSSERYIDVDAGDNHSVALKSDGTAVAWGWNWKGQCDIPFGKKFVDISAGMHHGLGIECQQIDFLPPTTSSIISPEPNSHGWNKEDVMVILTAVDNPGGSGVDHFYYVLEGIEHEMAGESAAIPVTTEGLTTITYWAVDADGNAEEPKTLTVMIDKTLPTISFTRSPDPNGHGWNNSDVTVHFDAEDSGSGHVSVSGDVVFSQEGAGQSVTGTATDLAGNTATVTVSGINIDKTPPEIVGSAETPPNSAGWYNTDVLVRFAIRDILSGLPEPVQREFLLTAEGPNQSVTGTAMDRAGNRATDTVSEINIDKTPPTISYTISPPPNALGWNTSDVTVTFRADDALSGVAAVSPPQTIITEGADQPVAGAARDIAGNSAQIGLVVSIDKSNPVVTISASPDILWPPNKKLIAVKILGSAADAISDIASITFTIKDEYGTCQPAVSGFGSIIKLEAWRDGDDMDGRHYVITVTVTDKAGRISTVSTTILVPHDEG